jgi:hypothetical protein
MPGVRIRAEDPALANTVLRVGHRERPMADGQGVKEYQIRFDDQATAIVSPKIWERLQRIMAITPACPRMAPVETVARPPALGIGGDAEALPTVRVEGDQLVAGGLVLMPRVALGPRL